LAAVKIVEEYQALMRKRNCAAVSLHAERDMVTNLDKRKRRPPMSDKRPPLPSSALRKFIARENR